MAKTGNIEEKEKRRPSRVLMFFHIFFLLISIIVIGRIFYIQWIWEPNQKFIRHFQPSKQMEIIEPRRGSIIDHNGKLLAISTPLYNIYMDCYVQKEANDSNKKSGLKDEKEWMEKAGLLSKGLAEVLREEGRDSAYYMQRIKHGRANKRKYVSMASKIDHGKLLELKELPLFNEPAHKGGLIVVEEDKRLYPYGSLARRVIGYVKNNDDTSAIHIGIEGKFHYMLHGKEGQAWERRTDKFKWIKDVDSTSTAAEDGCDVRTTIDINIQDIADKALRKNMSRSEVIESGCVVIMDVETGAVRAMVNLHKDSLGRFSESFNMAAGRPGEPGSVFKAVTLTTLLEDGKVTLDKESPTNHGIMSEYSIREVPQDDYILTYERNTGRNMVSVLYGFQISSNYVFRRLVKDIYGDRPEEFTSRLHSYNMGANFDFELTERGSGKPSIPDPHEKSWRETHLVSSAIGYSVKVTPLQVATFYNAIANDGKMMKPYIVERTEKDGMVEQEYGPTLLNSICSKATADTLTRALTQVTLEGTAKKLRNAPCTVAGKTGTARMYLLPEERPGSSNPYEDAQGRKKHQGTFVGFFPADDPKYTAIVVTYTHKLGMGVNAYGGDVPAGTFKDIVDELWAYETEWSEDIEAEGRVPEMESRNIHIDRSAGAPVPDVRGYGLKDAIYAVENSGYKCEYSGTGHVVSQTLVKGNGKGTIRLVLK